jgi:hypothetical protein
MKKRTYIIPACESFAMLTEGICDLTVSGLQGNGDITIGDGGDNDDDAPGATAKGTNLWDGWD